MLTLSDLNHLIAQYEDWFTNRPLYASEMHADTVRERLAHLRAQRDQILADQFANAA